MYEVYTICVAIVCDVVISFNKNRNLFFHRPKVSSAMQVRTQVTRGREAVYRLTEGEGLSSRR